MRNVIVSNLVSVDGLIAATGGDLSWFAVGPEFFTDYHDGLVASMDAILYGRLTYEMMRDYWTDPKASTENDKTVVDKMNELPKHVFSRTLKKADWGRWDNASVSSNPVETVKQLKTTTGGDMMIFGSGGLVSTLAPHGLIDEYRFFVNPTILGQGTPMFRGLQARVPLELIGSRVYDRNVAMLTYRPARS